MFASKNECCLPINFSFTLLYPPPPTDRSPYLNLPLVTPHVPLPLRINRTLLRIQIMVMLILLVQGWRKCVRNAEP